MNLQSLKCALVANGWASFRKPDDGQFIGTAESIGHVIEDSNGKKMRLLTVKERHTGIKNSFSFNFGTASFPMHTDTAYWSTPARYMLLTALQRSNVPTCIMDFGPSTFESLAETDKLKLSRAVFLLKIPTQQKFVSLFFRQGDVVGIRYDPNIMFPYNTESKRASRILQELIQSRHVERVQWTGDNIIVVDNWRMLHGRDDSSMDKERTLQRIYLETIN